MSIQPLNFKLKSATVRTGGRNANLILKPIGDVVGEAIDTNRILRFSASLATTTVDSNLNRHLEKCKRLVVDVVVNYRQHMASGPRGLRLSDLEIKVRNPGECNAKVRQAIANINPKTFSIMAVPNAAIQENA